MTFVLTVQAARDLPQSFVDSLMIFCAQYLWYGLIAAAVVVLIAEGLRGNLSRPRLINLAVAFGVIGGIGVVLGEISTRVIMDTRPFMLSGNTSRMLIEASTDNGFPSDHTLYTALVAALIFTRNRIAGALLFVGALVVGLSRIYCGVHNPLDVAGALAIALIALGLYYAGGRLAHRRSPIIA